jgi:sugar/nucleoside kinase (ribokinase family)
LHKTGIIMVDFAIYGKIIIDTIRLLDGSFIRGALGGGGPQGAFGARVWSDSVGLLTRSGSDIEPEAEAALKAIDVDLKGWVKFEHIHTPHGLMAYDENEYMLDRSEVEAQLKLLTENMAELLAQPIPIPAEYQSARAIHLITEYSAEPMVLDALQLKEKGVILSLEPIILYRDWSNRESILSLIRLAQTVSPDWPSASGIAGSDDPLTVVKFWSKLGPELVTVRHGANGSYAWDCYQDVIWKIPILPVKAVDPTGAGNSYGGGMCVGWQKTKNALQAGCYGSISASYLVKSAGVPAWKPEIRREAQSYLEEILDRATKL